MNRRPLLLAMLAPIALMGPMTGPMMGPLIGPLIGPLMGGPGAAVAADRVQVVYHLSDGIPQATRAMNNLRNHLEAEPGVRLVVVANGPGIDFALEGAVDTQGRPFAAAISELTGRGVEFRVCKNTLDGRKIATDKVAMEARIVASGVAEVARLQQKDGFAYLRP